MKTDGPPLTAAGAADEDSDVEEVASEELDEEVDVVEGDDFRPVSRSQRFS